MQKYIFYFIFILNLCLSSVALATEEGGKIILDIQEGDRVTSPGLSGIVQKGVTYYDYMQKYEKDLDNPNVKTDFIYYIEENTDYTAEETAKLQKFVAQGAKFLRFIKKTKSRIINWVNDQELPVVFPIDEYEMGEDEEYIESDKPLVIKDFKKIVAYSDSPKDKLSAKERNAIDNQTTRPSDIIKKYKKAFFERDWKTLFGYDFEKEVKNFFTVNIKAQESPLLSKAYILPAQKYFNTQSPIKGAIQISIPQNKIVLLNSYNQYSGIDIDFSSSKNLKNTEYKLAYPSVIYNKNNKNIIGYINELMIFFKADAVDNNHKVKISPKIKFNLCHENSCLQDEISPVLEETYNQNTKDTSFSTYVNMLERNTPQAENKKYFKLKSQYSLKDRQGNIKTLVLELKTPDLVKFNCFILGQYSDKFFTPLIKTKGNISTVRFNLKPDKNLDDISSQPIKFWLYGSNLEQYIYSLNLADFTQYDAENYAALGLIKLLLLAVLTGFIFNLFPSCLPLFIAKISALKQCPDISKAAIRKVFLLNSLGIFILSLILFITAVILFKQGYLFAYSLQFSNIYFVFSAVFLMVFIAYTCCFNNPEILKFLPDCLLINQSKSLFNEIIFGIIFTLLAGYSLPLFLDNIYIFAYDYGKYYVGAVYLFLGLGLSIPYLFFCLFPKLILKLKAKFLLFIKSLSFITAIIFAFIYSSMLPISFWRIIIYLALSFFLMVFFKHIFNEINLQKESAVHPLLLKKFKSCLLIFLFVIFSIFFMDLLYVAKNQKPFVYDPIRNFPFIEKLVKENRKIIVKIHADWCLKCKYNQQFNFDTKVFNDYIKKNNIIVMDYNWSDYNQAVSEYIKQFGVTSLPFYVIYSANFNDGIVVTDTDFLKILNLFEM